MNETYFIGIDLGTQSSFWVIQDDKGKVIKQMKAANERPVIEMILAPYRSCQIHVVMEATTSYFWMYRTLKDLGCQVILAHPLKTRAIASAKIKNDRLDASILCHLLRAGLIPQSYIPTDEIRVLREIARQHIRLVRIRTKIKNQCHALLVKLNLRPTVVYTDLFGKKGREWLRSIAFPPVFELQKNQCLDQIEYYNHLIEQINRQMEGVLKTFPQSETLLKIPGIGFLGATMILGEIGDIHRFPSSKQLVGYAGIAPGLYESAKTSHSRGITHEGNKYLRWILCEMAQHHVRKPGLLRNFYLRLKDKKGHGKAIVATARKLLVYIYYTLKGEVKKTEFAFAG